MSRNYSLNFEEKNPIRLNYGTALIYFLCLDPYPKRFSNCEHFLEAFLNKFLNNKIKSKLSENLKQTTTRLHPHKTQTHHIIFKTKLNVASDHN